MYNNASVFAFRTFFKNKLPLCIAERGARCYEWQRRGASAVGDRRIAYLRTDGHGTGGGIARREGCCAGEPNKGALTTAPNETEALKGDCHIQRDGRLRYTGSEIDGPRAAGG